ncbi:facilitated trehalose transporter Tret1-2 homolog [Phlebotomus argentipes]|uniref:facilitated trehalose transporter Tret1-2 homolog n=1 Tax=Phlebotomus argentipes TaxID=94469 RepID=UPI0028937E95|nr:facilitated trehalose transporter Tret1-2 homolog [Phlebotomus argentipes]
MIFIVNRGKVVQIFVGFAANFLSVLFGLVTAWTSPTIFLLQSPETPLEAPMTDDEVSWMTSVIYLVAVVGSLIAGWMANVVGRKWTLFVSAIPQLVAFILIFFAHNVTHILISRIMSGLSIGLSIVIIPIFVAEIADKDLRTTLGNFMGVSISFGSLLGKFLPNLGGFYLTPIVVCAMVAIFTPIIAILPDSPQYLLLRNRPAEAEKALKFYRGTVKSAQGDDVQQEFQELQKSPSLSGQKMSISLRDFCGGATILTILTSFWLSNHPTFTGNRTLVSFTDKLFRMSGTTLDIAMMDIAIAVLQFVASVVSTFIINRFGSRLVLIYSFVISFIAQITVGTYFTLTEHGWDLSHLSWLLFVALALAIAIPGSAINSLAFGMAAEIVSPKLRGFLLSIYIVLTFILGFVSANYFIALGNFWGISGWMWIFGGWSLISIFLCFFLPDIRNTKTFDDVLELFNKKLPLKWRENTNLIHGLSVVSANRTNYGS